MSVDSAYCSEHIELDNLIDMESEIDDLITAATSIDGKL